MEKQTRSTRQRELIMKIISSLHVHPTAEGIYEEAKKVLPNISLGTIYRNLDYLSDEGKISKINADGSKMRFEYNTEKHYHLICTKCGKVEDAPVPYDFGLDYNIDNIVDYRITNHKTEFFGICPDCLKKAD